ncbi:MAG: tRNA (N6-isopentenyl adenosine(37)-C2)-methylthiotransferase MiaB [Parvularculaceae bacterium]
MRQNDDVGGATPGAAVRHGRRKTVHVKTYGCQMNVYDSERMVALLAPHGYAPVDAPDDADLVILNTCHIREKAAEKLYSELGRLRAIKARRAAAGASTAIAVAGCVAQAEGREIARRAPTVDMTVGPQSYHRLPEPLARLARREGELLATDFDVEEKFDAIAAEPAGAVGPTAHLTVQEGCDKFCSFCVVPYTRGAEISRPAEAIAAEARRLVAAGAREITLLGQNVNAWRGAAPEGGGAIGSDQWGLGELCRWLARIDGLERMRFTTSHPRDMDDGLIAALGEEAKLMPYLHLPVQAGSDRILKAMNRGHTADDYRALIDRIRAARPDVAISGDFIVGFPGETAADFEETMALARDVDYASAYSFKYSRRPGTPGAAMAKQVADDEKSDRLARLQELLNAQKAAFNAAQVGRALPVLLEKPGRREGQLVGRSPYLQSVHLLAPADMVGATVNVRIVGATTNALEGELASATNAPRRGSESGMSIETGGA